MARQQYEPIFKQRLSPGQYAMMRTIADGKAANGIETLEIVNYTTFTALIKRGYVTLDRASNPAFTEAGYHAFSTYNEMEMPHRKAPGAITKFVADMFSLGSKINGLARQRKKRTKK